MVEVGTCGKVAQVTTSRAGYSVNTVVQVQKDAPAHLLIGTDLLPKLRFMFPCAKLEEEDKNLLESS